jgi:hypothetical protein
MEVEQETNAQRQQARLCRRNEMAKAESVESLSHMMDPEMRQTMVDVRQALELDYTDTLDNDVSSEADEEEDACSITSELNHLPTLQQYIRDDLVKAVDTYNKRPGPRLSFDEDCEDTESDDSDETVTKAHTVDDATTMLFDDLDAWVQQRVSCVDGSLKAIPSNTPADTEKHVIPRMTTMSNKVLAIQACRGTKKNAKTAGVWNSKALGNWFIQTARKWWRRGESDDCSCVSKQSDKKQLTPKEIKAIQKRVTLSNRSPNQQTSMEAVVVQKRTVSKTASGSIALMRVKAADGNVLRSSTNGFAKAASRRIWKLFATKQTSTSSEP